MGLSLGHTHDHQNQLIGYMDRRYAFTGREADGESSLLYFRARHYDPLTGMFLQRDPIGFAAGDLNLYAYTWNNPTKWSDPSGLNATIDYGANGLRSGAAAGAAYGGLFGAIRNLAMAISRELLKSAIAGAGPGEEAGPEEPGCEPNDPNCEEKPEECVDPSQTAGEPTDHFNERLAERGGTGPDWNEIIAKGTRHYDTKYGTTFYGYQGWQVSVLPDGRPNSIQPQRSNSTNNRVKSGRYRPC
ncbi:MAG: RHS repeat-associated core domain-containing protein [Tabrizicola sp.]|nr:RHS repeat-associated core domain-containing protein [Tabrizicola sp.]